MFICSLFLQYIILYTYILYIVYIYIYMQAGGTSGNQQLAKHALYNWISTMDHKNKFPKPCIHAYSSEQLGESIFNKHISLLAQSLLCFYAGLHVLLHVCFLSDIFKLRLVAASIAFIHSNWLLHGQTMSNAFSTFQTDNLWRIAWRRQPVGLSLDHFLGILRIPKPHLRMNS